MIQDGRTTATSPERTRKRSSRACDGCRSRRSKCEDVTEVPGYGPTCRACRENKQRCEFSQPARKRGPKLAHAGQSEEETGETQHSRQSQTGTPSPASRTTHVDYVSGIPAQLIDQLLAVYFAHVHNVWPVISKCLFHPSTAPPHLLLAMMAVASCVAPHLARDGLDSKSLYELAEHALHRRRSESRIDVIQSLVLLSLRQTGCGDKLSAAVYCGRACSMVYALGLHLAPTGSKMSPNDVDTRSRVFWNCYVLDKTLSEETGRPFLLSYRRSSIPLPNINEVDEFEAWPPLPSSTTRLLQSVQHIPPRRGHILSCFAWTCRLGMIVEEILDLENEGPNLGEITSWDEQFLSGSYGAKTMATVERIEGQIDSWKAHLPPYLDFDVHSDVCPLPHVIVCLGWYHTCRILLYTRSKRLAKHSGQSPLTPIASIRPGNLSHRACSRSAQAVIDLIACLERHRLLGLVSADIIHIVCLATLCQVYDSKSPDPVVAEGAKTNFNRCCRWLREFSATWSGASAHKLFFDGLIRSGAQLSGSASLSDQLDSATSLTAIGRDLSSNDTEKVADPHIINVDPGLSSLMQLPQYYWNNLTDTTAAQPDIFSPDFEFLQNATMDPRHSMSEGMPHTPVIPFDSLIQDQTGFMDRQMEPTRQPDTAGAEQGNNQEAVFSALMRYMIGAARTE